MLIKLIRGLWWAARQAEEERIRLLEFAKQQRVVEEVLELKLLAAHGKQYGPFRLEVPRSWEIYLEDDYHSSKDANKTLKERLLEIEGITSITYNETGCNMGLEPIEP